MYSGSLRTARALLFALALTTLAAIAYLSNRDWLDFQQSRSTGLAAVQTTQANQRLLGWVRDAETGQRGYLLTGRASYLIPYQQAAVSIPADLNELHAYASRSPQQVARVDNLRRLITEKLAELKLTVDTRDRQGEAAAFAMVSNDRGRLLMDQIRAVSVQIDRDAQAQLSVSRESISQNTAQARLVTLLGCALLMVIILAGFFTNEHFAKQRENLIAELAAANRASAEVRDLLRTTFYSIGDGVITTDAAGNVQMLNSAAERLAGCAESAARGKPVEEIFQMTAEGSRPAPANPVRAALADGVARTPGAAVRLRGGGAECFVESGATAIRDAAGDLRGAVLVFRDVTARMQSEERLRQAAKLESLGVLAGGIAHDFNNILVGILGNASLLEEYFPPGAPGRELVETLHAAGTRAARLTNQMLAYSGRGRFVVTRVSLSREVEEIAALMKASIPKNAELRLDVGRNLPPVNADVSQLQQLIMNLVINGAEALDGGNGSVEVSTSLERVAAQSVKDVLGDPVSPGLYIVLSVKDRGQGMDEETRARIFDPFFTTKFTGRGLGLAAVLGIVKGHGGAIEVDSAPGQGATFRVYFPVAEARGEPDKMLHSKVEQ
jgi:PAS domain S-box-containing protein